VLKGAASFLSLNCQFVRPDNSSLLIFFFHL